MKIIHGSRRSGKTTKLIQISSEKGFHIVCLCDNELCRVIKMANDMGKKIPKPITFGQFLSDCYLGMDINGFLFDNLDIMLQQMTSIPIHTITLTGEE